MDIHEEALKEHSRSQTMKIAAWIGNNESRFRQYLKHFLHDEYRVVQRISWVLSIVAESHPNLVEKNISVIINRLNDDDIHVAVKRNVLRVLQFLKIPPKYYAILFDHCINFILDPKETVAVRCFAMTVAARIAEKYPELKNELAETIKLSLKNLTPGLKVRSTAILKKLNSKTVKTV